jgi:serine phosphatase RsbU (regulator of sigma subunit)
MLPTIVPSHSSIDISVSMTTAAEIGGDYYDFNESGKSIIFAIGDATGHGARAGAMVTATKILFCNFAASGDPLEFIRFSSIAIKQMNLPSLYMALAAGIISPDNLEIAGAGLPPALLYRDSTQSIEQIVLKGLPLGSYGGVSYYKKQKITLAKGDTLLFMTDGLPEMFNSTGEMFGMGTCINEFRKSAQLTSDEIINHFNSTIKEWLKGLL